MRKGIIGGVCVSLLFLTTQGAAQQPSGAPPERAAAAPQKTAPRPLPTPAGSPYCMFEGKEFSIGAVLCVSSQMSQHCSATDTEHSRPWWSSGPQSLCAAARPDSAVARPEPADARPEPPSPTLPSIPRDDFPKTEP
jgi:hypothetical protein